MVDAGFFDMKVGSTITTAAVKERTEKAAKADAEKAAKDAAKPVKAVGLAGLGTALAEKAAKDAAKPKAGDKKAPPTKKS